MSLHRSEQNGRLGFCGVHLTVALQVGQATIRAGFDISLGTFDAVHQPEYADVQDRRH